VCRVLESNYFQFTIFHLLISIHDLPNKNSLMPSTEDESAVKIVPYSFIHFFIFAGLYFLLECRDFKISIADVSSYFDISSNLK